MNQYVKRFFAALFSIALCLPLIGMLTGLAQAQTQAQIQSRDMVENLSEFQVSPDPEIALWLSVANSENPAELEYYLERYPDGEYVGVANLKLDHLDVVFWQSTVDVPDLNKYLELHPDGRYAALAREKLAKEKSVQIQFEDPFKVVSVQIQFGDPFKVASGFIIGILLSMLIVFLWSFWPHSNVKCNTCKSWA